MTQYDYPNAIPGNIVVIGLKIERAGLPLCDGLCCGAVGVTVMYNTPLTPTQKTQLDTLMAQADIGAVPPNAGNTNYKVGDILEMRNNIAGSTNLDFAVYPWPNGYVVEATRVWTAQEKNKLVNAFAALLTPVTVVQ
jgi:hypothetical protein